MFQSLPGFRDFYPEACALRNSIFRQWREACHRHRFQEIDAPVLEPLELLTAKSGPEITSQLFCFTDKGGREVTLRPELTPSVARLAGAKAGSLKRPTRWFSIGEFYRYEKPQKGRLRAFYQLNADILGESDVGADAELIALMVNLFRQFGLTEEHFCIRLSDRNLWLLMLEAMGLAESAWLPVLGIVDKMEPAAPEACLPQLAAIEALDEATARTLLQNIEQLRATRSLEQLSGFFDSLQNPQTALGQRVQARLQIWQGLLDRLQAHGISQWIRIDLGIVRGLAYYTGFVFEAFQTVGKGRALAGGGRYDHLVEKLTGVSMPAVGFGLGDVTLQDLLKLTDRMPRLLDIADCYVVIGDEALRPKGLQLVAQLRALGLCVDYPIRPTGFAKQFKAANQCGAAFCVIVAAAEAERGMVKLKDMRSGEEIEVAFGFLPEALLSRQHAG
jgi:histidyl-tRNA synthetase